MYQTYGRTSSLAEHTYFFVGNVADTTNIVNDTSLMTVFPFEVPRTATTLQIVCVGGGGGGGGGGAATSGTTGGGQGGGSGACGMIVISTKVLPPTIYVCPGNGGLGGSGQVAGGAAGTAGQSGQVSRVCLTPDINNGATIISSSTGVSLYGSSGGNPGSGSSAGSALGTGESAGATSSSNSRYAYLGVANYLVGITGTNGSTTGNANSIVAMNTFATGGGGGGGVSSGIIAKNGSNIIVNAPYSQYTFSNGADGSDTYSYRDTANFVPGSAWGGCGGYGSTTSPGNNGGNGGLGSGGGGGGACTNAGGATGGAGGSGGPGYVIIRII